MYLMSANSASNFMNDDSREVTVIAWRRRNRRRIAFGFMIACLALLLGLVAWTYFVDPLYEATRDVTLQKSPVQERLEKHNQAQLIRHGDR